MTELIVQLPDELAQRARNAGLLTDGAIQGLIEDGIRRAAGRKLLDFAEQIHAANIPVMCDDEVVTEVKAARAEYRAAQFQKGDQHDKS